MAKKVVDKAKSQIMEDLSEVIANSLNSNFKEQGIQAAYFLGEGDDDPASIKGWISTGSTLLDFAISNRKHGGIPVGRITEITGLEQAGKSLVCAHLIADTQRQGGIGVYIDTENAVSKEFFVAIGVNTSKMVYVSLETIEDCFETIEDIIEKVRSTNKDTLVTIVLDSVAGATTKTEMAADFDKDGYATQKALILGKALRKMTNLIGRERIALVLTNQLRMNLNAMPFSSDKWISSGGKAIPFHTSVRVRLTLLNKLKSGKAPNESIDGVKVKAAIFKNRLGPPHREAEFDVYYASGIDDYSGWLSVMKDHGLVKQGGAYYTWVNPDTGEEFKFMAKEFYSSILSDPNNYNVIYDQLADALIMKYKDRDKEPKMDEVESVTIGDEDIV